LYWEAKEMFVVSQYKIGRHHKTAPSFNELDWEKGSNACANILLFCISIYLFKPCCFCQPFALKKVNSRPRNSIMLSWWQIFYFPPLGDHDD